MENSFSFLVLKERKENDQINLVCDDDAGQAGVVVVGLALVARRPLDVPRDCLDPLPGE